jgi:tRNA (guanine37-N1)-methyltransferase
MTDHPLWIDIVTIFPAMVRGFVEESILGRAVDKGHVRFRVVDLRDYTTDRHRTTDDRGYGGGPGMVMKPEPFFAAVDALRTPAARVILMSPQGRPFRQDEARTLSAERHLIFLCGHYEGVDERIRVGLAHDELSIGDYVLTNGTLAAVVVLDAVVRLIPGVLGGVGATEEESFNHNLLEYPQYTRPVEFRGLTVPAVLRSGDHAAVARWRAAQSLERTRIRRPDLLKEGME